MLPEDYCYNLAALPGSDFRYSLLGLPLRRRQALLALKAFCLETAQIVVECQDAGVARSKLDWWQAEVARLFAGEPQHPVTRALQGPLADYNLPEEYFREILDGVAMDLDYDAYPNFSGLMVYLHRQGSVPALLAAEISGYQDRRATPHFAHEAGIALILFDFLYNVRQHAQCGRLYWPEEEMARYGIKASDLLAAQTTERLRQMFAFQAERIRHHYAQALAVLPITDHYAQYHLLARLELMMALQEAIAEDGYRLLEQRTYLPPLRKIWLAWRLRWRIRFNRQCPPVTP